MEETIPSLKKEEVHDIAKISKILLRNDDGSVFVPTPTQIRIIDAIVNTRYDRMTVLAYTQFGKTKAVAAGIFLKAVLRDNRKIRTISISDRQSAICFNYVLGFISKQPVVWPLLKANKHSIEELGKELNKSRINIGTSEISILTANLKGKGENLLGFDATDVIEDEAAGISDEIETTKIRRMLGAKRTEGTMHVKISTPHRRGHFKDWCDDPTIAHIVVDYHIGLQEGRVTETFIEQQKKDMTNIEFGIWYECRFPSQDSNALFTDEEVEDILKPFQFDAWEQGSRRVISLDIARFGEDKSVFTLWVLAGGIYFGKRIAMFGGKDTVFLYGKMLEYDAQYKPEFVVTDDCGIGGGVTDMLSNDHRTKNKIIPFNATEKPEKDTDKYMNKASEAYFVLKNLIREGVIHYEENNEIRREMLGVTYEYSPNGKITVAKKSSKPDNKVKSPDNMDSAVYGLWVISGCTKSSLGFRAIRL